MLTKDCQKLAFEVSHPYLVVARYGNDDIPVKLCATRNQAEVFAKEFLQGPELCRVATDAFCFGGLDDQQPSCLLILKFGDRGDLSMLCHRICEE
jgi:hypothetical protein